MGVTSVTLSCDALLASSSGSDSLTAVRDLIGSSNLNDLVLYDLKLLDQNGNPVENFTGEITVKIHIPSGMNGDIHVYWYDPNANQLTDMNATVEGDSLVFQTTHFSYYAVAQSAAETGITSNPKTAGNGSNHRWLLMTALLAIAGILAYGLSKKVLRGIN